MYNIFAASKIITLNSEIITKTRCFSNIRKIINSISNMFITIMSCRLAICIFKSPICSIVTAYTYQNMILPRSVISYLFVPLVDWEMSVVSHNPIEFTE